MSYPANLTLESDELRHYELPYGLMHGDSVTEITRILGLHMASINNYKPVQLRPRRGSQTLDLFKTKDLLSYLDPMFPWQSAQASGPAQASRRVKSLVTGEERLPRSDWLYLLAETEISTYSFMPGFNYQTYDSRKFMSDSAFGARTATRLTEERFRVSPTEIKKWAAWSWYRTYELCTSSANRIEEGGMDRNVLQFRSEQDMQSAVDGLRLKATNARNHAIRLYPRFLDDEYPKCPSWGIAFTDSDLDYYRELGANYERARIFDMAQVYKGLAMIYICEAISLYVEWKEENPEQSGRYSSRQNFAQVNITTFAGAGGPIKLWAEAAEWSQETKDRRRTSFWEWFLRAVMARGHAESLLEELKRYDIGPATARQKIGIERLLPPPPVGFYKSDCGPNEQFTPPAEDLREPFDDDCYSTGYIVTQMQLSDRAYAASGERNFNFAPGAPDSLYHAKAKTGWTKEWLGLWPMDSSMLSTSTGYFERYRRVGLADFLPRSASAYEKALAICADDLIVEWDHQRYMSCFPLLVHFDPALLPDFETDLRMLMKIRTNMDQCQAERRNFQDLTEKAISHHMMRMNRAIQSAKVFSSEPSAAISSAAGVERMLKLVLGPWYAVHMVLDMKTSTFSVILDSLTRETRVPSLKTHDCVPLFRAESYYRLARIYENLNRCRELILTDTPLDDEERFFASTFRKFLETGDESQLPLIRSGSRQAQELTVMSFRKQEVCTKGVCCESFYTGLERFYVDMLHRLRLSTPNGVRERNALQHAFNRFDLRIKRATENIGPLRTKLMYGLVRNDCDMPRRMKEELESRLTKKQQRAIAQLDDASQTERTDVLRTQQETVSSALQKAESHTAHTPFTQSSAIVSNPARNLNRTYNGKCATCLDLLPYIDGRWFVEMNPKDLQESVSNGCTSCNLVTQALEALTPDHFRMSDSTVRLIHANDRDGLMVKISRSLKEVEVEIEIFHTSEQNSCAYPMIPLRKNTNKASSSSESFRYIARRIEECLNNHPNCQIKCTEPPSRLLDVSGTTVKLCSPKVSGTRYACLSHCWGSFQIITTTKANIEDHKTGIPWRRLSKTFQDAIVATRQLKLGYIWIDSLCIIQDDPQDWQMEAESMSRIYSGSAVTIAATGSTDGNGGLFYEYPYFPLVDGSLSTQSEPTIFARKKVHHPRNLEGEPSANDSFPLFRRGWVYQERLLSPRVVHFGRHELLWECKTSYGCECGVLSEQKYAELRNPVVAGRVSNITIGLNTRDEQGSSDWRRALRDGAFIHQGLPGDNPLFNLKRVYTISLESGDARTKAIIWRDMVTDYSRLFMTRQSDRLPAFLGLIQYTIPRRKSACLAGIWLDSFYVDILWLVSFTRAPVISTTPTWSWASVGQWVCFPKNKNFAMQPERVYATEVSFSSSTKAARCGLPSYESTDLHISGPVAEVRLKAAKNTDDRNRIGLEFEGKFIGCDMFHPDSQYWKEGAPRYIESGTPLLALRIASYPECDRSLILIAVDEQRQIYERVGIFSSAGVISSFHIFKGNEPIKTLTII